MEPEFYLRRAVRDRQRNSRLNLPDAENPIYFGSAAGVVELVDTRDSKFRELCSCRFESDLRYHLFTTQTLLFQRKIYLVSITPVGIEEGR